MAAPTLVQCASTRATGTADLDLGSVVASGGPTEGDLCVIVAAGANGAVSPVTDVTYTSGGASAGYTSHVNQASGGGTNRLRIWSKVLTSADYAAVGDARDLHSLTLAGWTNTGAARWAIFIVRHADSWDTDRVVEIDLQTANVANGSQVASIAKTRAGLMFTGLANLGSTVTLAYNGSSAIVPYMDESTTSDADGPLASPAPGSHGTNYGSGNAIAQADLQAYDTGSATITITASAGLNNANHVVGAIYFQVGDRKVTITDAVGITDAGRTQAAAYATVVDDAVGITDEVPDPSTPTSYAQTVTDPVGIADAVPRDHVQTVTDAVGILDNGVVSNSVPDVLYVYDEVYTDVARALTDPVGVTDPRSYALPGVRVVGDPLGLTDSLAVDQVVSDLTASCLATIVWNDSTLKVVWADLRAAVRWCS